MSIITCENICVNTENFPVELNKATKLCVYKIDIPKYYHLVILLKDLLNADEQKRSERFHFETDAKQFIICRALLKLLLAKHAQININDTIIYSNDNGKPFLKSHKHIGFNISHSKNCAIIVIDQNPVGVDIEFLNYDFDFEEVLPYSFDKLEQNEILNAFDSTKTFFMFWTRKEAIVKMTGKGLDDQIAQIHVKDGSNNVDPLILNGLNKLAVWSFEFEQNYIVSIATCKLDMKFQKLFIYELPSTLSELKKIMSIN